MRELDVETEEEKLEKKVSQLIIEREEAINTLRDLCREHGDNDWSDDLHLADIIDKHLGRHLDR
jgi:predicted secreted protein